MRNTLRWLVVAFVPLLLLTLFTQPGHAFTPDHGLPLAPVLLVGTIEVFSTTTLLGVLENLKRPVTGLLDRFFAEITQSQSEDIAFDIDTSKRYLAPFVHPLVSAPVKQMKGVETKIFRPAYIKEKARYTPDRPLRRGIGEGFGGTSTPEQRRALAVSSELAEQADRIIRRKEAMALEALMTGTLTISGIEEYPDTVVDFQRDESLEADYVDNDLTGGNRWTVDGSDPNDNLDDMSEKFDKLCGAFVEDVVMDSDAWKAFRKNKKVLRDLELPKYDAGSIQNMEPNKSGLQYKGQYGGYRIWKYSGFYTAANGTETKSFSGGYALCIGQIDGTQHHGAIQDEESGNQPLEIFPKSWVTPEPSVRWIMSQSAPIVVPRRSNACGVLKVINNA